MPTPTVLLPEVMDDDRLDLIANILASVEHGFDTRSYLAEHRMTRDIRSGARLQLAVYVRV